MILAHEQDLTRRYFFSLMDQMVHAKKNFYQPVYSCLQPVFSCLQSHLSVKYKR